MRIGVQISCIDATILCKTHKLYFIWVHVGINASRCLLQVNKTKFMRFDQDITISLLNGKPLKLVDQFIYLGSNILSTENDIDTHIG